MDQEKGRRRRRASKSIREKEEEDEKDEKDEKDEHMRTSKMRMRMERLTLMDTPTLNVHLGN